MASEESVIGNGSRYGLDETLKEQFAAARRELLARGATEEEIVAILTEAARTATEASGRLIAEELGRQAPEMLAEHAAIWDDIRREVRAAWGPAIDAFYEVVVCVDELGKEFWKDNIARAEAEQSLRFKVMTELLAQACRCSVEVWTLLLNGLPTGAAARARSLHEMNVVVRLIEEHGDDLARRYLDHEAADQLRYVLQHDDHADEMRRDRFEPEVVGNLQATVDALEEEYGRGFARPYGWAAHLTGGSGGFRALEKLAGLSHWRADYMASSLSVHPTAWSATLNQEESALVTSWRLTGLAEPAAAALVSLHQVAGTVLLRTWPERSVIDATIAVAAVGDLVDRAQVAFGAAEEEAERRLLQGPVHPPSTM